MRRHIALWGKLMHSAHPRLAHTAGRVAMVLLLALLWVRSSATAAGPAVLLQEFPVGQGALTTALTDIHGQLYFGASDKQDGTALWKSDGTAAGTTLIKTLHEFQPWTISSIVGVNNRVLFWATNGATTELWTSDGTTAGTSILIPEFGMSAKRWASHASSAGMSLLIPSTAGSKVFDDVMLFIRLHPTLGLELWKTDGTSAGTQLVENLNPTFDPDHSGCGTGGIVEMDGREYFLIADGNDGMGLWRSDKTSSGTTLLFSFRCGTPITNPLFLVGAEHKLFFSADDGIHGQELWTSDGTTAGTHLVKDIVPGPEGSSLNEPTALNNLLVFVTTMPDIGTELWKSDGTESGTGLVKEIFPGYAGPCLPHAGCPPSFGPAYLTTMKGVLYFGASDTQDSVQRNQLWRSDGTANGTSKVKDVNLEIPAQLADVCGALLFSADTAATGSEPWFSDGTPAGTKLLQDVIPGAIGSNPTLFTRAGNHVFFATLPDSNTTRLWALPWPVPRPAAQAQATGEVRAYLPAIWSQQAPQPC
jgi:ELWxxDGT repeat protein